MKTIITLALLASSMSGCVVLRDDMVNPQTGKTFYCKSVGIGPLSAIGETIRQHNCVKRMESLGYIVNQK